MGFCSAREKELYTPVELTNALCPSDSSSWSFSHAVGKVWNYVCGNTPENTSSDSDRCKFVILEVLKVTVLCYISLTSSSRPSSGGGDDSGGGGICHRVF